MNGDISELPSPNKMHPLKTPLVFTVISAVIFVLLGVFGVLFLNGQGVGIFTTARTEGFEKFRSEQELRDYITQSRQNVGFAGRGGFTTGVAQDLAFSESATPLQVPSADGAYNRVSTTNVQVVGLDEPDIIKTDGESIFFSNQNYYIATSTMRELVAPDIYPAPPPQNTKIISAIPPESIGLSGKIEEQGNMLLDGNMLMIIGNNKITGYNVSNPQSPEKIWVHEFDENFGYNTARLVNGRVYLISNRYADYSIPCPVPLMAGAESYRISCTDIYRPSRPISADSLYSIVKIDTQDGSIEDSVTFLGEANSSVIYMSPGAIYAAFVSFPNPLDFMAGFLAENRSLFGDEVVNRVNSLRSLDISDDSKLNELNVIFSRYVAGLSNDERERVENELSNKLSDYTKAHGRELQVTSIVKIGVSGLDVEAVGEVPGGPLNQFSLDEWNGNLRIATTVSAANSLLGRGLPSPAGESANDLYVLDGGLKIIGRIQGLALGERIYSARFIEDKAYLVTFRQIDPFFVIDLTDAANPRVAGELKIPGFSSYLHPLSRNLILGVGQEEWQSKLSVFDVSNPDNPVEVSKYLMSENYSEVQNNHHAFLLDPDNNVFFIPAGDSGYVFSWEGGLSLKRVVSGISARRALYIGNYMYIAGDTKMVVLNEETWGETSSLGL